jgi:hypothetical protein
MIGRSSGPATFKLSANVHWIDKGIHGIAPVGGREHQYLSVTRCRSAATSDAADMVSRNPIDSPRSFPGLTQKASARGAEALAVALHRGKCDMLSIRGAANGSCGERLWCQTVSTHIKMPRGVASRKAANAVQHTFFGKACASNPRETNCTLLSSGSLPLGRCRRPPFNSPATTRFYRERMESRSPADRWIFSH